jgi:hypothetical protein
MKFAIPVSNDTVGRYKVIENMIYFEKWGYLPDLAAIAESGTVIGRAIRAKGYYKIEEYKPIALFPMNSMCILDKSYVNYGGLEK